MREQKMVTVPSFVPLLLILLVLLKLPFERLLEEGIYVIGFFYPVVPKGQARIRTQISAAHTKDDLDFAVEKFQKVGRELRIC